MVEFLEEPDIAVETKLAALSCILTRFSVACPVAIDDLLDSQVNKSTMNYSVVCALAVQSNKVMRRLSEEGKEPIFTFDVELAKFLIDLTSIQKSDLHDYAKSRGDLIGSTISTQEIWNCILLPGWQSDDPDGYWLQIQEYLSMLKCCGTDMSLIMPSVDELLKFMIEKDISIKVIYDIEMCLRKAANMDEMFNIYTAIRDSNMSKAEVISWKASLRRGYDGVQKAIPSHQRSQR